MSNDDIFASLFGGGGGNSSNISDLANFQKTLGQNDYWRMAAAPVLGAKFNTSTWSPGETIGVTAGQAFLGALLNRIGQKSEAAQLAKVAEVLPELYANPRAISVPEGVDPEAFGGLKLAAISRGESSRSDQLAKIMADVFATKLEEPKARLKARGEILGKSEAYGMSKTLDPDAPQVKGADVLRKELLSNKEINEFGDVKNRVQVLQKAISDPTSVADLDFVYGVAKILDPSSVVRESEGRTIIDSNSIPGATLGYINKALSGETALNRKSLYDLAARHYDTRKERVGSILDNYTNLATKRGVDPVDILPYEKSSLELPSIPKVGGASAELGGGGVVQELQAIRDRLASGVSAAEKAALVQRARELASPKTSGGIPIG